MKKVVIDIESNGLLSDLINYTALPYKLKPTAKLWCVCLRDVETGESHTLTDNFREQLKTLLVGCTEIIGHNILKFDLVFLRLIGALDYTVGYPVMDGLEGTETTVFGRSVKLVDTLLWSRLFHPDRYGGHSLAAWGDRLGVPKTDYRGELVKAGLMTGDEPKGFEFSFANDIMLRYCEQDTVVTVGVYNKLLKDWQDGCWDNAYDMEAKLADLAIRRETFGFAFDKDLALKNLQELDVLLKECQEKVEPNLPPMPLNRGQQDWYTPPVKQFLKSGKPNSNIHKWAAKHGGSVDDDSCTVTVYGETYQLPLPIEPIVKAIPATIDNGDWVKQCLLNLGWIPLEWKERDLTKDSKKQPLDYQKRVEALDRWWEETLNGKFKEARESELGMPLTKKTYDKLLSKLSEKWPVRVPTSPCVRTGVEKKLCDNLVKLGEKVAFAQDFAHYLTYKHRKSAIAGGKIDEIDLDEEAPPTGYLSMLREDGRVSTPAIEVGASCVPANTRLLTWDGYKKIIDVKIGDKVLTHKGIYQEVTDCIDNGVKPTYKVTLSNGMELTCTSNHPFCTTEGWVRCEDLNDDDVYIYGSKEVWKDVKGFEGYKVSNWGGVIGKRGFKQKPLTSKISGRPCSVDLYTDPYTKVRKSIGRLVCEAFNGGDATLEVRHLDGNSWNNNASNLVFGTSKENSSDWKLHGSCGKVASSNSKLSSTNATMIKQLVKEDGKRGAHGRVAKLFNVSREHVRDICSGKRRGVVLNTESNYVQKFETAKVVSVEYVCDQPTFDITVEDAHSYVAEGIVVHNTNRYKHIGVANVPRASSLFGAPMRGLFGCGEGGYQFGFDFSSLEARIQGHYIWIYGGEELAEQLLAPKPNSIHCINARKLNITRDNAKSITYAILYGSGAKKVAKMLGISVDDAQKLIDAFWDSMLPLKMLRDKVVEYWVGTGKKYIKGIDGRKLYARSEHSLLNLLFQGGGVICAKYTTVAWFNLMERQGLQVDCFTGDVDVCGMIEMHDEVQAFVKKNLISFKTFDTKEAAEEAAAKEVNASSVGHAKRWYYCPENTVSKCLMESLNILQKELALNVPLGVEWVVGRNWLECH